MLTKKSMLLFVLISSMATVLLAQSGTIVFTTRPNFIDAETGESPDMQHITVLEDAGYDVIQFYNASLSTAGQETLDTLYNADLIIMGRSTPSADYGNHKKAWNDIPTPTLCLEMWAVRNNRLNWLNTTNINNTTEEGTITNAIIDVPDDPVFEGLDTSAPVPWIVGSYDVFAVTDAGFGTVLARMESDDNVLFVRWESDDEFYPGSGDFPGGPRTLIGNGRDDGGNPPFNYNNFTLESEQVFLAEVARMVALGNGSAVENENATAPSDFVLFQNFPNPFNPTTTIPFHLPEKSRVRLSINNVIGKEIVKIMDREFTAGYHEISFNADHLAAGIYCYKIETEKISMMKKLVLIK